jgi:hypothetical protein
LPVRALRLKTFLCSITNSLALIIQLPKLRADYHPHRL